MEAKIFYAMNETPPDWALKQIGAGRLKGMTDINPQWRIKTLVESFGFCGIGWKYEVKKLWFEQCGDERLVFAEINLFIKNDNEWSDIIPGIGGSKMITKESAGLHNSDECYKMAITDALSVACKMLGIGGSIYSGSKYVPIITIENEDKNKVANDNNLTLAKSEIEASETIEKLNQTWNNWSEFHTNKEFIFLTKTKKTKINGTI